LRSTLESISALRRVRTRSSDDEEVDGNANGGWVRVDGVASSSQVAEGKGTDTASKETRLFGEERRGRVGLALTTSEEDAVVLEEREDARIRLAMVM